MKPAGLPQKVKGLGCYTSLTMSEPLGPINTVMQSLRRLVPAGSHILVACSGGPDSMALLFCAIKAGYKVHVGHVVHDMRPRDVALVDKKLVENFCASIGIPFYSEEVYIQGCAKESARLGRSNNVEDAYREGRLQAVESMFHRTVYHFNKNGKMNYLITGHHADDQLETMLMKLCRGAGLRGMSGIAEKMVREDHCIVRPMLGITKSDCYAICRENNLPYTEDMTNQDIDYTRNAIRHKVLPLLKNLFPYCSEQFSNAALVAHSAQLLVEDEVKGLSKHETIVETFEDNGRETDNPSSTSIKVEALRIQEDIVIYEWLRKAYQHAVGRRRLGAINKTMCDQVILAIREKKNRKFIWPHGASVRVNQTEVKLSEVDDKVQV